MSLSASTIHAATILQAFIDLEEQGIEESTTSQVGEILLRPQGYDMGGRLHGLSTSGNPVIDKLQQDGHNNLYCINDYGREYLKKHFKRVQTYGEYALIGKDKKVLVKPTGAALNALEEMQKLIDVNVRVKVVYQNIINQIEQLEREVEQ